MSVLDNLRKLQLISPPKHLENSVQYETIMGSVAYGVSSDTSDMDVYGFSIPPKNMVFPHLSGQIQGFGKQIQKFEQYQQHHVINPNDRKEYDLTIYSIIKYFQLCMDNNPNMIDSLFTPQRCVLHCTQIGNHVRENRKLFLHKGSWFKFKGYAYSQVHKMNIKNPEPGSNRYDMVQKYGYDLKFAYHVVRLLNEVEMIMTEYDLDLQRNREQLKSIRRGEWTKEQIIDYFESKEKELEKVYSESKLQHKPDESKIKQILFDCLEMYYGNLEKAIIIPNQTENLITDMKLLIEKYERV